jgi:hypothetical protein
MTNTITSTPTTTNTAWNSRLRTKTVTGAVYPRCPNIRAQTTARVSTASCAAPSAGSARAIRGGIGGVSEDPPEVSYALGVISFAQIISSGRGFQFTRLETPYMSTTCIPGMR